MPFSSGELSGPDLHRHLHNLRPTSPVIWVPAIDRWLVTSHQLVLDALRDPARFTVDDPRFTTSQVVGPSMLSLDGAEHTRHRGGFAAHFRRRSSRNWEPRVRELANRLVAAMRPEADHDLRADLAAPLAVEVITETLGLEGTDPTTMLRWYRSIVAAVEAATSGGAGIGTAEAMDALRAAVQRTAQEPGSAIATIAANGDLSPDELVSNTAVVLFGAIETSEGMIANALHHVLSADGVAERLEASPTLIPQAVEESLRLEPAATLVDRYLTTGTEFGGVRLPARAPVALSLAGANRDPAVFDAPDRFDLDRHNAGQHLTFVQGPHACIGMHLARLEAAAALEAVLARQPVTALDLPAPEGLVFRKPARVVVRFAS